MAGTGVKKSVSVSLLLMGTAALGGCNGEKVETAVYQDAEACTAAGIYGEQKCESDFQEADRAHRLNAPAFATAVDCQKQFGKDGCQPTDDQHASGAGHFIPFMTGYLIGRFTPQTAFGPQPLYQFAGSKSYRIASGAVIADKPGRLSLWPSKTTTMRKGGFGSRAHGHGG